MNRIRLHLWLVPAALALLVAACAPTAPTTTLPAGAGLEVDLAAAIDSTSASMVEADRTVGLAVGVRRGNEVYLNAAGHADLASGEAVTSRTVFRIGSITKQFAAAGILRLADEGRIDLDDPIDRYIPEYPTHGHRVTIRHLLNHTGGMPSYTDLISPLDPVVSRDRSHDEILATFAHEPFVHAPGEGFFYNNSGYYLLGLITEAVTGLSWDAYMDEAFFGPLGLDQTFYCPSEPGTRGQARGYRMVEGAPAVVDSISMTWPYAAGALCSTVGDLLRWDQALHGGEILSSESYAAMTTPHLPEDAALNYGYGLIVEETDGRAKLHHGGGIHGFVSQLAHFPDEDLSVVVLTNTEGPTAYAMEEAVVNAMLGIEEPEVRRDIVLTEAEMEIYTGIYRTQVFRVRIFVEDGVLMMQAMAPGQGAFPLIPQGSHEFYGDIEVPVRVRFTVVGDRAADITVHQGPTRFHGPRLAESEAEIAVESAPLTAEERARLVGRFDIGILEITVFEEEGRLMARATGQGAFELLHLGDGVFGAEFDETMRIEFDIEGERAESMVLRQQGMTFEGDRLD